MEKEMKKLLLVSVSVGVFLLVTITVALIVITPKPQSQETAFSSSVPYSYVRPAQNNTGNLPVQPEENIPLITIGNGNERTEVTISADRNDGNNLTIHVPTPATTVNESSQIARIQPAGTPSAEAVRTTAGSAAQTTARQTTQPASALRSAPASASTRATASSRAINDYWIQTGAFSAIVRAEDARELLASKGLVSIIENRIIDGRTWYRVRLGPYTSEKEASHWLAIVKAIDGFSESQIRQTIRQQ